MTAQRIPAAGLDDRGIPRPRTSSYSTVTSYGPAISHGTVISSNTVTADRGLICGGISGVRSGPGESDPSRMLSGVLVLVIATIIMGLTLVWWLA